MRFSAFFATFALSSTWVVHADPCDACKQAGENMKGMSLLILVVPSVVLGLCLMVAVAMIWYFISVVGREVVELERITVLFADMIVERGIPSELSKAVYGKTETQGKTSAHRLSGGGSSNSKNKTL